MKVYQVIGIQDLFLNNLGGHQQTYFQTEWFVQGLYRLILGWDIGFVITLFYAR